MTTTVRIHIEGAEPNVIALVPVGMTPYALVSFDSMSEDAEGGEVHLRIDVGGGLTADVADLADTFADLASLLRKGISDEDAPAVRE
ncbi:hypothetical protein JNUCC0626_18310 [Lentzea sp. JNUCC 0626]|uniref:hypothetical protein n=1 Tax=Lentzea sp. JNUCC 0626 TaxID=3367513 RepID=UPI003748F102